MLHRLPQRGQIHVVIHLERGGEDRVDVLELLRQGGVEQVDLGLTRLDVQARLLFDLRRSEGGGAAGVRSPVAFPLFPRTFRFARRSVVRLGGGALLLPLALLPEAVLVLHLCEESASFGHARPCRRESFGCTT